jgi:DNA polymerase-3 subunit alpha
MDFLGLRNLTILDDAIATSRPTAAIDVDLDELSRSTTRDLRVAGPRRHAWGLPARRRRHAHPAAAHAARQLRGHLRRLALYRPGPMGANSHTNYALRKTGKQPITPIHPELEEPLADILGETYGLIVYQEQVQHIAQRVAGYTLGKADMLRRAMGKKKKEILDAGVRPVRAGMQANGYSDGAIKALWDILVPFSDYAFNKAHTAAYGMVSYWTGVPQGELPAEYMAALLTSVRDDKDKSALYLNECRHMGIKVLPPDVNSSIGNFAAVGTDIRFGLSRRSATSGRQRRRVDHRGPPGQG